MTSCVIWTANDMNISNIPIIVRYVVAITGASG